jgi:O-antigen/teichoic acid export membrane protein
MNNTNKKLTTNALSAVVQVVFTAFLYFFLYKYLLDHLGAKSLGVWSLILSFSSIANLANMGLTSGLVKFVAESLAEKQNETIGKLILTSFVSLALLFCLFSLIILLSAKFFLYFFIDKDFLNLAFSIIPWSLGSLCINACSGIFTSVLEGYQKNYLRNFIYVLSGIIMFVATLQLTPIYNLQGVAIAQFLQSLFVLLAALFLILRINPYNRFGYWKWSTKLFKELFDYGYKFQAVSICQLLYEPTTKMLLSKYGGLALLGHYEMATRLVSQCRALLVNANQVVIPVVAETAKTRTKTDRKNFYVGMSRIMTLFTFPLATILVVLTPLIAILWMDDINIDFSFAMYVLALSSIFNVLCGPAYFSCIGEGRLSLLVFVHAAMAVLNLVIAWLLGQWLGGYGIILGWGLALSIGSIFLLLAYNRETNIDFKSIVSANERHLIFTSLIIISISIAIYTTTLLDHSNSIKIITSSFLLLLFIPTLLKNDYVRNLLLYIRKAK